MTSPEFIYTKKCINSLYGDIQVVALVGTSWLYFMHMMALKNRTSGSVGEYYSSDDFTDALHDKFQLQTDLQIVTTQEMKNIFKCSKNKKTLLNCNNKLN